MKKFMVVLAAMAFVIAMAGSALASRTSNVNVSGTVKDVCTGLATMTIPDITIDPSLSTSVTGTTSGTVKCTKNHDFQVQVSSDEVTTPQNFISAGVTGFQLKQSGAPNIPYTVKSSGDVNATTGKITGNGLGAGAALTVGIIASILQSDAADAWTGAYTDTVYLTIVY